MYLFRAAKRAIFNNSHLLWGIIIGLLISSIIVYQDCPEFERDPSALLYNYNEALGNFSTVKTVIKTNASRRSTVATNPVRPRYYSTELGIREKLFVGVLTSEERVETLAVHINETVAHLVDKVKFFISANLKIKTRLKYGGLVGFTDTRHKFRPFQIVKYIADNLPDYDYYYIMNDYNYLNVRRLKERVGKISVSMNVYLGTVVKDASYCDLDAGILISNSVLKLMREHIDWCVMNAVSDYHSENIGRCVYHSANLDCQDSIQEQNIHAYKLKQFVLASNLQKLSNIDEFNNAISVYPILQEKDFHLLHSYFSKQKLIELKSQVQTLSAGLPEWPAGHRIGSKPATRFDVPRQYYFNLTHMFFPSDYDNIREHTESDLNDINNVLEAVKAKALYKNEENIQFRRLINGYRSFQLSRGMDYKLDLGFRDLHTGKEIIKRFEVCKPLSNVELIPAPYVTENSKVVILLPIEEHRAHEVKKFISNYAKSIMEHREKTFLMLVFLYQANTTSKGENDPYNEIKSYALKLSNRMNSEDTKIRWVSIRLPNAERPITLSEYSALNFAIIDLALKKIGLESLILVLDINTDITPDLLNRVRMNTITNYQIFSIIPFRQYNPKITNLDTLEINKNTGQFDREEFRFVSFYARDYVFSRKLFQYTIPLIRVDNDISNIITADKLEGNVFEMFVKYPGNLHCFRATDMSLKVSYTDEFDASRNNIFLGTKSQLGSLILSNIEKMPDLI